MCCDDDIEHCTPCNNLDIVSPLDLVISAPLPGSTTPPPLSYLFKACMKDAPITYSSITFVLAGNNLVINSSDNTLSNVMITQISPATVYYVSVKLNQYVIILRITGSTHDFYDQYGTQIYSSNLSSNIVGFRDITNKNTCLHLITFVDANDSPLIVFSLNYDYSLVKINNYVINTSGVAPSNVKFNIRERCFKGKELCCKYRWDESCGFKLYTTSTNSVEKKFLSFFVRNTLITATYVIGPPGVINITLNYLNVFTNVLTALPSFNNLNSGGVKCDVYIYASNVNNTLAIILSDPVNINSSLYTGNGAFILSSTSLVNSAVYNDLLGVISFFSKEKWECGKPVNIFQASYQQFVISNL